MPLSIPASFDNRDNARETLALGQPAELSVELTGLKPGAVFLVEILDHDHGNAMGAWEAMGAPETPDRKLTALLREVSMETSKQCVRADESGQLVLQLTLSPWSVLALREL